MWVRQGGGVREAALPCSRLRLDIQFSPKNIKLACWLQTVQSAGTFARHGDSRARFMHRSPRASQNLSVNVEMKEKHAFFFLSRPNLCGGVRGEAGPCARWQLGAWRTYRFIHSWVKQEGEESRGEQR